ncbi:MAG TPA: hypothetical protein VFH80_17315 [Solirubrobacteraceae bacterium]|nr:hypothetical protein [Solirubrobacteraceae bacterium]
MIGGVQAGAGDWRPLFWIVAAFGALCAGVRSADLRGPGPRRTYGIPGDRTGLPEGGDDVASGNNSFGSARYNGPAPPPGHGPHHYYFWVYSLDDELDLEPGLDRRALLERIEDHVIEQARVVGTYEH